MSSSFLNFLGRVGGARIITLNRTETLSESYTSTKRLKYLFLN